MKTDAARNGGASNTGTGYLPFTFKKTKTRTSSIRIFEYGG